MWRIGIRNKKGKIIYEYPDNYRTPTSVIRKVEELNKRMQADPRMKHNEAIAIKWQRGNV